MRALGMVGAHVPRQQFAEFAVGAGLRVEAVQLNIPKCRRRLELADRLVQWAFNENNLLKVLPHAQKRMETLSDFAPLSSFLVSGTLPITESSFDGIKGERELVVKGLQFALWRM